MGGRFTLKRNLEKNYKRCDGSSNLFGILMLEIKLGKTINNYFSGQLPQA